MKNFSANSFGRKCLSFDQYEEINQKSSYVNFSTAVLDFIRTDINKSEKDLWEFLAQEAVFSEDKEIIISNDEIAKKINRSVRTVTRLLSSLVRAGYIEREIRAGKASVIRVRLPELIKDELEKIPKRKMRSDKIVGGKTPRSYYLYNINNNNKNNRKSELVRETEPGKSDIVVSFSDIQDSKKTEQIENLEHDLRILEERFTELAKQRPLPPDFYDQQRTLGEKMAKIETKIKQITPKQNKIYKPERTLTLFDRKRIAAALAAESYHAAKLAEEIAFSTCDERGSLLRSKYGGELSVSHGVSIALKLIREGRWETPRGMRAQ